MERKRKRKEEEVEEEVSSATGLKELKDANECMFELCFTRVTKTLVHGTCFVHVDVVSKIDKGSKHESASDFLAGGSTALYASPFIITSTIAYTSSKERDDCIAYLDRSSKPEQRLAMPSPVQMLMDRGDDWPSHAESESYEPLSPMYVTCFHPHQCDGNPLFKDGWLNTSAEDSRAELMRWGEYWLAKMEVKEEAAAVFRAFVSVLASNYENRLQELPCHSAETLRVLLAVPSSREALDDITQLCFGAVYRLLHIFDVPMYEDERFYIKHWPAEEVRQMAIHDMSNYFAKRIRDSAVRKECNALAQIKASVQNWFSCFQVKYRRGGRSTLCAWW